MFPILALAAARARWLAAVLLVPLAVGTGCQHEMPPPPTTERYLYVWVGDEAGKAPDFLAVIDFNQSTEGYGKVLATVPLPGPSGSGNEPNRIALSRDGRTLACAGLGSGTPGRADVTFFDLSVARTPRLLGTSDAPLASVAAEICATDSGGFLVTMMAGAQGRGPGRVAEFDSARRLVAEYPSNPPKDGFNPLGISIRPEINLMVTSDYLPPSGGKGARDRRGMPGTIRVWNYTAREILRTIRVGRGAGTYDVCLVPGDEYGRGFTTGAMDNQLYLIDTSGGLAKAVFDFSMITPAGRPQALAITRDGTRLFVALNAVGKVVMLGVSDPERPTVLKVLNVGSSSGPHEIALSPDENRLVLTDCAFPEGSAGKAAAGDHKIRVAKATEYDLDLDPTFVVDLDALSPTGSARPRGVAMKRVEVPAGDKP
jgi:DNA-binding beta-propeller fold protein YncE